MVTGTLQDHITSDGLDILKRSILFTEDESIHHKEKEFLDSLLQKRYYDLNTKELNKLKDIARDHIPSAFRVKLWVLLMGGEEVLRKTPELYEDTCNRLFSDGKYLPGEEEEEESVLTYYLSEAGISKLQKILVVIKDLNPDITYCPLLEPITAIVLHFVDEDICFACITGLLSNKYAAFFDQTKFDNARSDVALQDLFKSINKKGYSRLESFARGEAEDKKKKNVLFPQWRNMLFEKLDFLTLVRILDCLFVEGPKILFRVGLYLLNTFHVYSQTFQNLQCSAPQDLITTIGQYASSMKVSTESFMKAALKIKFTSRQILKINEDNKKLYKDKLLEYSQSDGFNSFTRQVIAVDLNKVSDIIKPTEWLQVCEWLPARIQIKQPFLLFSTHKDGFNLRTLYLLCEEEEQTLFVIKTEKQETIGAYLSSPLIERQSGHSNLTFFGTGETFIFNLYPTSVCYLWNKHIDPDRHHLSKNRYVFVDTTPISIRDNEGGNVNIFRRTNTRRKTLMKRLSRKKSKSRRRSTTDKQHFKHLEPLSAINVKSETVPHHLAVYPSQGPMKRHNSMPAKHFRSRLSQKSNLTDNSSIFASSYENSPALGNHFPCKEDGDDACHNKKMVVNRTESESDYQLIRAFTKGDMDNYIEMHTMDGSKDVPFYIGTNDEDEEEVTDDQEHPSPPPSALFISCDNSTFVVGGGGGQGLYFDGDIKTGRSSRCDTYRNEPLTSSKNGDFQITRLDVFGFI